MTTIKELEEEVTRCRKELGEAQRRLMAAKLAACGVSIGDVVVGTGRGYAGKLFRVSSIDPNWSPPWLRGNPQRADGSFGTSERNLFGDWQPQQVSDHQS